MKDQFVSALLGEEMDAALLDMAHHNSEAWAVGKRNGTAVSSGDETYHNNAYYYSQMAEYYATNIEVFTARYGQTTSSQLNNAINVRKVPVVALDNNVTFVYVGMVSISGVTNFLFASVGPDAIHSHPFNPTVRYIACTTSGNTWSRPDQVILVSEANVIAALALKAPLDSPSFTGTVTAPTPGSGGTSAYGNSVTTVDWVNHSVSTVEQALMSLINGKASQSDLEKVQSEALNAYVTDNASGSIASFSDGADSIPMKSFVCSIEPIQAGSGDPSPSNIRAISGHSGVNAVVAGINVWDEEWEVGGINNDTGANDNLNTAVWRSKNYLHVKPNTAYYFQKDTLSGGLRYYWYDKDKAFISGASIDNSNVLTSPTNAYFLRIRDVTAGGNQYANNISVNYPSSDHGYHAYVGTTYPVDWTTEVGGDGYVYKGSIDLVSGVLTVTHVFKSVDGTETITGPVGNTGDYQRYYFTSGFPNIVAGSSADYVKCSHLKSDGTAATNGGNIGSYGAWCTVFSGNVRVGVPFSTKALFTQWLADMKTAGTPVQFVYELATPLVYNLTQTEVLSLLGQNNCYNDCGDTAVVYRADTKLYIDKRLGGNVQTLSAIRPTLGMPVEEDPPEEESTEEPTEDQEAER